MFLLEPNLYSKSIINQHVQKQATFYCYSSIDYKYIELWTDLSLTKDWHSIHFIQQTDKHYYKATVNLSHLNANACCYEFTVRYKMAEHEDWSWLGQLGQNGSVYLINTSLSNKPQPPTFAAIPQLKFIAQQHTPYIDLWHFKTHTSDCRTNTFHLGALSHPIHSFTAIIRKGSTWLTPVSGYDTFENHGSEQWQLFIYQDKEQGNLHLWIVISDDGDCWLTPSAPNSLDLHHSSQHETHLITVSSHPQQPVNSLFDAALDYYYNTVSTKTTTTASTERALPAHLLDKLGYCTWNAFGQDVDMTHLQQGLRSLNIPIGYLLLDDGWQSITQARQLNGFDTIKEKFPMRLKQSVNAIKLEFPSIQYIGIWHTLWGYWNGIDREFAEKSYGWIHCMSKQGDQIGLIKDPDAFYHDFYQYVRQQGIDFVKVDNQGGFQDLVDLADDERMTLWNAYRSSFVKYGDVFFDGYLLHCMSLTPPILFHPIFSNIQTSLFRNSDDFFPDESSSHAWHIYANIINSLLTSYYPVVADWDMFQSDHPFAEYHAASRAISGGPVYISDPPFQHNPELIQQLLGETRHAGMTLLRSSQTPKPTFHTLFRNPMGTGSLIGMFNVHQEQETNMWIPAPQYHVYAFFNTTSQPQLATVCPPASSSVVGYVVSGPDKGTLLMSDMLFRVDGMGASIVSLSPTNDVGLFHIACLGLTDKLNGTKAIVQTKHIVEEQQKEGCYIYRCLLSHKSSRCGFWLKPMNSNKADFVPRTIRLDNQLLSRKDWSWDRQTGLLLVDMMAVPLDVSSDDTFCIDIYIERK